MRNRYFAASVLAVFMLSIAACHDFNNVVDPQAPYYQGYPTVQTVDEITAVTESTSVDDLKIIVAECIDASEYNIEIYESENTSAAPFFEDTFSSNIIILPEDTLTIDTWYYRVQACTEDSEWGLWSALAVLEVTEETQPEWSESFESYFTGIYNFPYPPWTPDANAEDYSENFVTSSYSTDGDNSLELFGENYTGANWSALAFHSLGVTAPFKITLDIYNSSDATDGDQDSRGGVGLRFGTYLENAGRKLISFDRDGYIKDAEGNDLTAYSTDRWYSLSILYERPDSSTVKITYSIADTDGFTEVSASSSEDYFNYLELSAQQGRVWFDNIKVYQR